MANEQELLSEEEIVELIKYTPNKVTLSNKVAEAQVAKLKAMGYEHPDEGNQLMRILVDAGIVRMDATPTYSELLMVVKTFLEDAVKWDREKVAKAINHNRYHDGLRINWSDLTEYEKSVALDEADQLKVLLAGG